MEDFIYWTFETRHSDGFTYRFAVHEHEDGAMQITRISPYDETEYHWASKSAGRAVWRIIRDGRTVSRAGATGQELAPEEVAHLMLDADQKAHLDRCPLLPRLTRFPNREGGTPMKLYINANRAGYAPDQIRSTMTVGELIAALGAFDEDTPVYLRHDGGYTYGGITWDDLEEGSEIE